MPFLQHVAAHIYGQYKDTVEKLCIILPNRRGALFLKKHLASAFNKAIWLPDIISIEDLVERISGLKTLEEIDLICHLYESYKACYGTNAEGFDGFARWGQLMLQDFNEIDRSLADPAQLYDNLRDIKVIENWSLGREELSAKQHEYLAFMASLGHIYRHYTASLLKNKWAYGGLAYREAVRQISQTTFADQYEKLLFCGFNALNTAELKIINAFYTARKAELLWDADVYYLNDKNQEAGYFLRQNFKYFGQNAPDFTGNHFTEPKQVEVVSVPGQLGQAQVVRQSLEAWMKKGVAPEKIAVVLASETLLWPVLRQLPEEIKQVNITMEYPIRYSATFSLLDSLLQIQVSYARQTKGGKTLYHKDLISLFRQPLFRQWIKTKHIDCDVDAITQHLIAQNISFISSKKLEVLFEKTFSDVKLLIQPALSIEEFNRNLIAMLELLAADFSETGRNSEAHLEQEFLDVLLRNFRRLTGVLEQYPHFSDIYAYRQLFTQVVGNATAPFIGEPLSGLQVMGVLETRTLDFDYLILVNVNEGVLPSGKSIHSFIPNDLKKAFGLQLYTEKDAVYAYHFYRLLQRSPEVIMTYDSETDSFGKGEKSRFITQLQMEMSRYNPLFSINERVATYSDMPAQTNDIIEIEKQPAVLEPILKKAINPGEFGGLSPSGLLMFKECGLRFYFRYGAGLKEAEEVEESAEASTFGSILHLSLEKLYTGFTGQLLSVSLLKQQLARVDAVVNECFLNFFGNDEPVGKSLLQEEVIKVYVKKLMESDVSLCKELDSGGQTLTLRNLEHEFTAPLQVAISGHELTIYIKGKIDRIDDCAGQMRVIDYKSSVKESDKFVFEGFENLFTDKNYNKQLQLMMYVWLLHKNNYCPPEIMAPCIVPFRVFSGPRYILGSDKKPLRFSNFLMNDFESALSEFIGSIFAGEKFVQTQDQKTCEYCAYRIICTR